ncbi:uncharacterized protein CHSO_1045 [Chryseobacterium sp. StRB126]|uniref:hypothetical protein n=1 Tax=Chryseobacterium sp. StRB126 TaxID=878220 RepID=UPI0004E981F3|nr:hypothetical protein [Chryseobacterium sp. StRB126]BAP30082.1 uncharacterized protein CHSO_1045 [Chryseobacterium sp. StRB126]
MKTKLIILTAVVAVVAALLYSCSGDRDENITPAPEKTIKQENLKLNPIIQNSESNEFDIKSDTIRVLDSAGGNELPTTDGGDPTTITPPHR